MKIATSLSSSTRVTSREFFSILGFFLLWRGVLFVLGYWAAFWLPYQPSFPYFDSLLPSFGLPQWLYSWANFDGVHYLTIVIKGYFGTGLIQAFFPGYPLFVKGLTFFGLTALVASLLLANVLAFVFFVLWFWWLKIEYSAQVARQGLVILALFPTAFFMGATYSESLFLVAVAASFIAARKQFWWLAGLMALVASATRVVGILLIPALVLEICQQRQAQIQSLKNFKLKALILEVLTKDWSALLWVGVGSLGLLSYMFYLQQVFQDPLFFLHVQSEFGAGRQETLVMYPQVVWRYLKILVTYQPHNWKYFSLIQEAVVGTLGLLGILFSFKKVRWSYWFFSLAIFIVPTLTGTFSSMPRYLLPSISLWMMLAVYLNRAKPWVLSSYLVCSGVLLVINLVLFIQGYWVA